MKKLIKGSLLGLGTTTCLVLLAAKVALGYSPYAVYNIPDVATGIGAKLACSARYVSELDDQQAATDIAVYSPILDLLDYSFDDTNKLASASLLGLKTRQASFKSGLGCALVYESEDKRETLEWPTLTSTEASWPLGDTVNTIVPNLQKKLDKMLITDNKEGHDTRALVVVKEGKIVAESYTGEFNKDSVFIGWSMSKSVNSLIAGHLEYKGLLNDSETHLFPAWQHDERKNISLKNMLQMTDGLDFDETYHPGQTATQMLFQTPAAALFTQQLPLRHPPGTINNYSSGTANLISDLIQKRIEGDEQKDINFIVEQFFKPLGMTSITYEMDQSATFLASSYLYASARDWARIGQLMINKGKINGERIVNQDWVERSLQKNSSTNKPDYGYQWWLNTSETKPRWPDLATNVFAAKGSRSQFIMVIPDEDLVIVRLGWSQKKYRDNGNFKAISSWF